MSANLKGPFYISSLKVKKKENDDNDNKTLQSNKRVSVNAHTVSSPMVKNGTCSATATARHCRTPDPTKTLTEKLGTKIPSPLAAASSRVLSFVMLVNKPTYRENLDLNPGLILNEGLSNTW